jgi:hypothetical protein
VKLSIKSKVLFVPSSQVLSSGYKNCAGIRRDNLVDVGWRFNTSLLPRLTEENEMIEIAFAIVLAFILIATIDYWLPVVFYLGIAAAVIGSVILLIFMIAVMAGA